jgi:hypothetical protein
MSRNGEAMKQKSIIHGGATIVKPIITTEACEAIKTFISKISKACGESYKPYQLKLIDAFVEK